MGSKSKKSQRSSSFAKLWEGIDIQKDFYDGEDRAENVEIGPYNKENMIIFSANVNYARQLTRLSDSLKPAERRILYTMYRANLRPGTFKKSVSTEGAVTEIHPHGNSSVYATIVGMSQYWKKQCPLIDISGAYGTEVSATYAASRYTEASISQYAWDCFFKDYDEDCVQTIFSTSGNRLEPVSLPSRYPNILINGGVGIATGNAFRIPPFNIADVIRETKKKLYDDNDTPVYIIPDFPSGCDIVDIDNSIKRICETGAGTLRMRAKTEIIDEGKHWAIRVTNLPWGVTMETVHGAIVALTKSGQVPIKDTQDRHSQIILDDGKTVVSHVDYWIIIDKAHDPYAVREKLFKKTRLEDSVAVSFKVVLEELKISELSLSDLIRNWIEERREYKRRLLNKKISKVTAQIELLKILIELLNADNLDRTIKIIKDNNSEDVSRKLVKEYGMTSYQAEKISGMRLNAFTKDSRVRYKKEIVEQKAELDRLYNLVHSEKAIDDIIAAELDELNKYVTPRKSAVINVDSGQLMDVDTEYFVLATKKGCVKKIAVATVEKGKRGFGNFDTNDYPTHVIRGKNMDSVIFVDGFGKYSVVKIGDIDTMILTDFPSKAFTTLRLEGEIIAMQYFQGKETSKWLKKSKMGEMFFVMISRDGFVKKCSIQDLIEATENGCKTVRNMRMTKLKSTDFLAHADYYLEDSTLIIYTSKGRFIHIQTNSVPSFGKDATGNQIVKLDDGDYCVGCCAVNPEAKFIVVITAKGYAKKCEIEFLGGTSSSKESSYLATLDANDSVVYVDTPVTGVDVCTRLGHTELVLDEIKTLSRKAKPVKRIPLQQNDNIIRVVTE